MESYNKLLEDAKDLLSRQPTWNAIEAESMVRMKLQNRFESGVEVAKYCSKIMRKDMAEFEKDPSKYTQSLGCWHGFVAQQVMISVKKHFGTTSKKYLYLSGWMVAAMRSQFGPLPDQVSLKYIFIQQQYLKIFFQKNFSPCMRKLRFQV